MSKIVTIIGAGGSLASIVALWFTVFSSGDVTTKHTNDKSNSPAIENGSNVLIFDYMRLFGALEVPLFMELISQEVSVQKSKMMPEFFYDVKYKGKDNKGNKASVVSKDLIDFWRTRWKYKSALPFKNELWETYAGSFDEGTNLYWNSINTINDLLKFSVSFNINDSGEPPIRLLKTLGIKASEIDIDNLDGITSENIGFLFLIIKNDSKKTLHDVAITYKKYENKFKLYNYHDDNYEEKINRENNVALKTALSPVDLKTKEKFLLEEKVISAFEPEDTFIWLISIYKKDINGFPEKYLTNVYEPVSVSYNKNSENINTVIRKPYKDNAMRISVPSGWFGQ